MDRSLRGRRGLLSHAGQALHNVQAEPARKAGCTFEEFIQYMREDDAIDAELTSIGIEQANEVKRQTKNIKPQLILVSPLSRAIDTGVIIFANEN